MRQIATRLRHIRSWETSGNIVILMQRQADLSEVIHALGATSRLTGRLYRREQQSDQHGDDRDHHKQLYQCKCPFI
jgi:hypothetical protein